MCHRRQAAEQRSVVQQAIEATEFTFQGRRQIGVILHGGAFQIQGINRRLWMPGLLDFIIDAFELSDRAAE